MKVRRFYEKQTEFTLIRPHNINSSLPASVISFIALLQNTH